MPEYSDYIIYADESGDPNPTSVDSDYPVFVLNFCVFRKDVYADSVLPAVAGFKFAHFGHDMVVLHEHDIRRRNLPFTFLQDEHNRTEFMEGLSGIIAVMDFTIIATVIDKRRIAEQQTATADLYELSFGSCLTQAHDFLQSHGQYGKGVHIVMERRGIREDNRLEREFQRTQERATSANEPLSGFEIIFADKKTNSTGLQIADLTARPIGRHFVAPEQPNRAWNLLSPKLFNGSNPDSDERGLTVLPETRKARRYPGPLTAIGNYTRPSATGSYYSKTCRPPALPAFNERTQLHSSFRRP